jgi:hypothetical protein
VEGGWLRIELDGSEEGIGAKDEQYSFSYVCTIIGSGDLKE